MFNGVGSVLGHIMDVLQCMGTGYICKCGCHYYSIYFPPNSVSV